MPTNKWGLPAWKRHQAKTWQKYRAKGEALGFFSVPEFRPTEAIADMLGQVKGPVLDVGCGVLPMPNYLKRCNQPYGIDPYAGDGTRDFPFAQAMGEWLPFPSGHFAAVLSMSALDHALDLHKTLRECWRVLRRYGLFYLWYRNIRGVDRHHHWTLTTEKLLDWTGFGFERVDQRHYTGGPGYFRSDLMVLCKR